jgi:hypothetical protein
MQYRNFRDWREILVAPPFALTVLAAAVGISFCGAANAQPAAQTRPTVSVVHPEKTEPTTLQVPGRITAYTEAPIYAQTSGYLKAWYFDIGAKVKANDIHCSHPENRRSRSSNQIAQSKFGTLILPRIWVRGYKFPATYRKPTNSSLILLPAWLTDLV